MTDENIEKLRIILDHYGKEGQLWKLQEECGELIEAVNEMKQFECEQTVKHYIEELADVTIMVNQMMLAMTIDEISDFWKMIDFKLNRQLGRIANEKS